MKNLEDIEDTQRKPSFLNEEWIARTLRKLDKSKMTPEQRLSYEISLVENAAAIEIQEDHERELTEKVTKEVTKEVTKKTAKKLKEKGWSLNEIAEFTGLEINEIEIL